MLILVIKCDNSLGCTPSIITICSDVNGCYNYLKLLGQKPLSLIIAFMEEVLSEGLYITSFTVGPSANLHSHFNEH